eukprot:jgi/Mesvir1/4090/Mv26474-RA.1
MSSAACRILTANPTTSFPNGLSSSIRAWLRCFGGNVYVLVFSLYFRKILSNLVSGMSCAAFSICTRTSSLTMPRMTVYPLSLISAAHFFCKGVSAMFLSRNATFSIAFSPAFFRLPTRWLSSAFNAAGVFFLAGTFLAAARLAFCLSACCFLYSFNPPALWIISSFLVDVAPPVCLHNFGLHLLHGFARLGDFLLTSQVGFHHITANKTGFKSNRVYVKAIDRAV